LTDAKVVNELVTIPGGGHGGFTQPEYARAFERVWKFLKDNKISE
jgi:hypothetical protein